MNGWFKDLRLEADVPGMRSVAAILTLWTTASIVIGPIVGRWLRGWNPPVGLTQPDA